MDSREFNEESMRELARLGWHAQRFARRWPAVWRLATDQEMLASSAAGVVDRIGVHQLDDAPTMDGVEEEITRLADPLPQIASDRGPGRRGPRGPEQLVEEMLAGVEEMLAEASRASPNAPVPWAPPTTWSNQNAEIDIPGARLRWNVPVEHGGAVTVPGLVHGRRLAIELPQRSAVLIGVVDWIDVGTTPTVPAYVEIRMVGCSFAEWQTAFPGAAPQHVRRARSRRPASTTVTIEEAAPQSRLTVAPDNEEWSPSSDWRLVLTEVDARLGADVVWQVPTDFPPVVPRVGRLISIEMPAPEGSPARDCGYLEGVVRDVEISGSDGTSTAMLTFHLDATVQRLSGPRTPRRRRNSS